MHSLPIKSEVRLKNLGVEHRKVAVEQAAVSIFPSVGSITRQIDLYTAGTGLGRVFGWGKFLKCFFLTGDSW